MSNYTIHTQMIFFGQQIQTLLSRDIALIGIGTDICEMKRMSTLYARWHDKIAHRILSEMEFDVWLEKKRAHSFLAKRWAGKEAIVKSLGVGFAKGLRWREISILNDQNGKPFIEFLGQTKRLLQCKEHWIECYISLADEKTVALGFSVAFKAM